MKRTLPFAMALLLLASCSRDPEQIKKGLVTEMTPSSGKIGPKGVTLMTVENKTGEKLDFTWSAPGACGELKTDPAKSYEARFVGREGETICEETVTLSAAGATKEPLSIPFKITVKPVEKAPELVLRPSPIPETWTMINDFDDTLILKTFECKRKVAGADEEEVAEDVYLNKLGATFDAWSFEEGVCSIQARTEKDGDVLAMTYDIATDDSYCGYFENLKLAKDCETRSFDLSEYDVLTFITASGDEADHVFSIEVVQWEKYAEFHQGKPSIFGPIKVNKEWTRHEIPIKDLCKKEVDPTFVKSISFKVPRKGQPDKGVILLDNVALIKKEEKK